MKSESNLVKCGCGNTSSPYVSYDESPTNSNK